MIIARLVVGLNKVDPNHGCLFIARHATHNADVPGVLVCTYHLTGRVFR